MSRHPQPPSSARDEVLDQTLLELDDPERSTRHSFTVRDAVEGVQIFGATGSGKTTGSGRAMAMALLRGGFGGLVLTVKGDEADLWRDYLAAAEREDDLVILDPEGHEHFNFLGYEFSQGRGAGLTMNLASLFNTVIRAGADRLGTGNDAYWEDALSQLLTNAIDLAALGTGGVTLPDLLRLVQTAPRSRAEAQSLGSGGGFFGETMRAARQRTDLSEEQRDDLEETLLYWLMDFAQLHERTRSIITNMFTARATGLLRGPLRRLLCTSTTDGCTPEATHAGKVVVLNLPIKNFHEVGRFAQLLYKTVWQRATERRHVAATTPPVFLWADEAQHFVTDHDALFQQTARSKRVITVLATQNLPSYMASLHARGGEHAANSLVGNLQTKIFHANGDPVTNEWAIRLFGEGTRVRDSDSGGRGGYSITQAETREPLLAARDFATLRKGKGSGSSRVDAIVFQAGRPWGPRSDERSHILRTAFSQS